MNLTSPSQVRALLDKIGLRPCKALGQNFLIDRNILDIIIDASDLSSNDVVLEIGPGLGVVTERLVQIAGRVMAIEKDARLFAHLKEKFGSTAGLELVCGDAVDLDVDSVLSAGFNKLVSNLPYSSGSRILMNLATARKPLELMVVTVQEEVAERMCALHSTRVYGIFTIWLQAIYDITAVKTISSSCFWPAPDVGSTIVRLCRNSSPVMSEAERNIFCRLTKRAFQHRRKQMHAIFRKEDGLALSPHLIFGAMQDLHIPEAARPEDISVSNWRALACKLAAGNS